MRKGLTTDDVGVSRDIAFQEIRPGAGFETADFVKEGKLGGLPCSETQMLGWGGYRRMTLLLASATVEVVLFFFSEMIHE